MHWSRDRAPGELREGAAVQGMNPAGAASANMGDMRARLKGC